MVYILVDFSSRSEAGDDLSSEYPTGAGGDAVRVSSGYPPDFVVCLIGRILFDFFEVRGMRCYHDIGTLTLAEVLRDFFEFEILGRGPASGGEGMVMDLVHLYNRFYRQERLLVQCMGAFDREGLKERLVEIHRSMKQEP